MKITLFISYVLIFAFATAVIRDAADNMLNPPNTPPLSLFGCNTTIATGCGMGTSCESMDDACNVASATSLKTIFNVCSKLGTHNSTICLPESGEVPGTAMPICQKFPQKKEFIRECTDHIGYECSVFCQGSCYELEATMIFA
mmetsp:Transcript_13062/g.14475  ORF Transcript_13062/g.14475 Transcript_13062/m.14475 type:complete len:143 (-) Transcript_13062:86-514(-)